MAPGALQIIIIILLVMVLFGAGRIPTIMENLAKGINSFKKGLKEGDDFTTSASDKKSADAVKKVEHHQDSSSDN